jgi:hypothetical protein
VFLGLRILEAPTTDGLTKARRCTSLTLEVSPETSGMRRVVEVRHSTTSTMAPSKRRVMAMHDDAAPLA